MEIWMVHVCINTNIIKDGYDYMKSIGLTKRLSSFLSICKRCVWNLTTLTSLEFSLHSGIVDDGYHYFFSMSRDYCIKPCVEHYAYMVDLLGHDGHLKEAEAFINILWELNKNKWWLLICQKKGDYVEGDMDFSNRGKIGCLGAGCLISS